MPLTVAAADQLAKDALQAALHLGWPSIAVQSRYCDRQGRRRPQYAASHVRTEIGYGVAFGPKVPATLWEIATVLHGLPGAVAAGTFLGDEDSLLRPSAWVLREVEAGPPTRLPVTPAEVQDLGHVHACATCGRRFTGARADARYCSNACRQRAYRQRDGGGPGGANPPE
jgi:hypothetical protein